MSRDEILKAFNMDIKCCKSLIFGRESCNIRRRTFLKTVHLLSESFEIVPFCLKNYNKTP